MAAPPPGTAGEWRAGPHGGLCSTVAGPAAPGAALGLGLGQSATITVDGTTCTLVDAITAANTDTAVGGCTAGSGIDTLVLAANSTHTLTTVNNTILRGATGLPVVTSTITIQGNGSTVQRDSGAPDFRLLAVDTTGNLTVQQLTLQGGLAPLDNSGFWRYGGGVYNRGTLTLSQCTVSGNSAGYGGGVYVRTNSYGGTFTLRQTLISGNLASSGAEVLSIGGPSGAWQKYAYNRTYGIIRAKNG